MLNCDQDLPDAIIAGQKEPYFLPKNKMNIALDYDRTYTEDPKSWDKFIAIFRAAGHKVYCVTMRFEDELGTERKAVVQALEDKVDQIIFTNRQAKKAFLATLKIEIDVWIDDEPTWILYNAI